ncbi:response regulator transcription factor [Maribellus sp. YY47]|uniref:response regulator transcription factor n=1 Tax=Maribellus sp. YY47 TaxID=2929486 RepID=UPI002001C990|nr:response regulator transcription factor [Maribellus sp. YY47]MCK3683136.1 response regulator transcription factor [Maribellus sp. YY47]
MKKINIYVIDDHSLFREGLKFLLSQLDFVDEIYEAENGLDFLKGIKEKNVDVALLDIEMPGMNGTEAAKKALEIHPGIKIIAVSMYSDESYYATMIEAGANGFLLKNSNFTEVKKAITDVLEGRNYFSMEILQSIVNRMNDRSAGKTDYELTERETEVLSLICKGCSNQEIADILSISKRTVDKHRENLLLKTQSKNTANLVVFAIKNGYYSI